MPRVSECDEFLSIEQSFGPACITFWISGAFLWTASIDCPIVSRKDLILLQCVQVGCPGVPQFVCHSTCDALQILVGNQMLGSYILALFFRNVFLRLHPWWYLRLSAMDLARQITYRRPTRSPKDGWQNTMVLFARKSKLLICSKVKMRPWFYFEIDGIVTGHRVLESWNGRAPGPSRDPLLGVLDHPKEPTF
jgi:hypothetical protein